MDSSIIGDRGSVKVTVTGSCPVGTDPQIHPLQARDYSGWYDVAAWGGLPGKTTSRTFDAGTLNQGQRFRGAANTRCVSPYTTGPVSFAEDGWDVRPITTTGWVNAWSGRNGLYGVAGASGWSGCPTGTRYQWEWAQQVNYGYWSGWSGWYNSSTSSVATGAYIGYGGAYRTAAHVRCVTDFAIGPVSGTSYSGITYTPLPVPAVPAITDLQGANSCNGKLVQIHGRYNAVAYANSYQVQGRARIPSTNWYTGWISGSASSGNLGLFFSSSQVISANGSQVMIRSVGTNITSAWSSTATVTKSVAGCFN